MADSTSIPSRPLNREQVEQKKAADDELIRRYKSDINLATFAEDLGFAYDKKHSTRAVPVLDNPTTGQTIIVRRNAASGEYFYTNPKDNYDKGNIINLASRHYNLDLSTRSGWDDLHKKLSDRLGNVYFTKHEVIQPHRFKQLEQGSESLVKYFNLKPLTDTSYLENERKIDRSIIDAPEFAGKILNKPFNDTKAGISGTNTVFPLENEKGIIAISTRNTDWNSMVGEKQDGIWVSNINPAVKPKEMVILESPINALSYHQLHPPKDAFDRVYIATCGNASATQPLTIQKLINKLQPEKLILSNDNDPAGIRHNINMMSKLHMPQQPVTGISVAIGSSKFRNTLYVEVKPELPTSLTPPVEQIKLRIGEVLNRRLHNEGDQATLSTITSRDDITQIRADFPNQRPLLIRAENLTKELRQSGASIEIKRSMNKDWNDDLKEKQARLLNQKQSTPTLNHQPVPLQPQRNQAGVPNLPTPIKNTIPKSTTQPIHDRSAGEDTKRKSKLKP